MLGRLAGVRRSLAAVAVLVLALALLPILAPGSADRAAAQIPSARWTQISGGASPAARGGAAMAYDPASAQMILFGGSGSAAASQAYGDTWSWTGSAWVQLNPATSPSARSGAVEVWDPASAQLLLFGGIDATGAALSDTWVWTGSTWSPLTPAASPPGRGGAMADWDAATGQLVLFGGADATGAALADTWIWTGSTWTQQNPGTAPPARANGALAYDPATGQLLLFGGNATTAFGDTWSWGGTTWTRLTNTGPGSRNGPRFAYDPVLGRLILFGGCAGCGGTFSWDGSAYTSEGPNGAPTGRLYHDLVFDPRTGQLVVFGGLTAEGGAAVGDTWVLGQDPVTAPTWIRAATSGPAGRAGAATAYDAATGQLLLFGGYNGSGGANLLSDTWAWNGSSWTNVTPAGGSPPARRNAAIAFDAATGQLLLFGGQGAGGALGDTWSWRWSGGSGSWTNITPAAAAASPSARSGAAAGFDAATGQLLLYGGTASGTGMADTWSWTGSAWTQLGTSGAPGPRASASLGFDPATAQMLLTGGLPVAAKTTDTWVWNGTTDWVQSATPTAPGMASARDFDPVLGRTVAWDPRNGRTWTWSASGWTALTTARSPLTWSGSGTGPTDGDTTAVFDPATGQLVVTGGWTAPSTYAAYTWVLNLGAEVQGSGTVSGSTTLTGYDRTIALPLSIQVENSAAYGWAVSATADHAPRSGSASLAAFTVNGSTLSSSASTAPVTSCASNCGVSGTTVSYPVTMPTTGTAMLFDQSAGSGLTRLNVGLQLWVTIPASTSAGTYTDTITITTSTGP